MQADTLVAHDIVPTKAKEPAAEKGSDGIIDRFWKPFGAGKKATTPVEKAVDAEPKVKPIATLRKDQWALPELTEEDERKPRDQVRKEKESQQGTKRTSATSQESSRKRR